ncbi:hypothetical protein BDF14DRAFT_1990357, partial [Spinellus fusiger]
MMYIYIDLLNKEAYECKKVKVKEILSLVWKYTSIFDKHNINSLGRWLNSARINSKGYTIKRINRNTGE